MIKTPVFNDDLLLKVRNPDVAWVQMWLNLNAGANLEIDGVWGTVSRSAFITAFANRNAPAITEEELLKIALELGDVDTNRIKAVAVVESNGGGFFNSGLPKILWERHKYWLHLKNVSLRKISWFANPSYGDYTMDVNNNGINDSWEKLSLAIADDPLAAFKSISIGKFQVLGEWYRECGYAHPIEMLWAASRGEKAHYEMLRDYILKVGKLKQAFLKLNGNPDDCRDFAKGYNGSAYERYKYHIKLADELS